MRIKVIGAGSAGNHLANAARCLNWHVDLVDNDQTALTRTRDSLYPGRYGFWDNDIGLFLPEEAPIGGYDFIAVATPPETHIELALAALKEGTKAVLIEKPLCTISQIEEVTKLSGPVFVDFTHTVGDGMAKVSKLIEEECIGEPVTIDVEFREDWRGVMAAHPWLKSPADTYLAYPERGGGATSECCHGIHLWCYLANLAGVGSVAKIGSQRSFNDDLVTFSLVTNRGLLGRVVQDFVTWPPRKWAKVQGKESAIEWEVYSDREVVTLHTSTLRHGSWTFPTTRQTNFIKVLEHIASADPAISPLSLASAMQIMRIIKASFKQDVAYL